MDYSNSHVVTLDQYVVILKYKVMDEKMHITKGAKSLKKGRKKVQKD